jgi:hypothetical protein
MRVIDAEELDTYLTTIVRALRAKAQDNKQKGSGLHLALGETLDLHANTLSDIADHIAEMSQEGTIYLEPTTSAQSSDMSGPPHRTRISPLHTLE